MTLRIEADRVVKTLASPAKASTLLARTAVLRRHGVRTPAAVGGDRSDEVVFERIAGPTGLARIVEQGVAALGAVLEPLAALHAGYLADAKPFDPEAKIRPRLPGTPPAWIAEALRACRAVTVRPAASGLVHGDFHGGQIVFDGSGRAWLLDFDDLATGPCEIDLGNFAAHLATRPETRKPSCLEGFEDWLSAVLAAYPGAPNPRLARAHGTVALVRRALKLAALGDPSVLEKLARGCIRV